MTALGTFIVIPARNEESNIAEVIRDAEKFGKVVVVDDGSEDKTYYVAASEGVLVLKHLVNLGKGAALKTGCDFAITNGAEKIVVIDADAQHNPKLIPSFLDLLKESDIVFGYREFSKDMPAVLRFGNRFINYFAELLYGVKLNDTQCGYRAFKAETYKRIRWRSHDYSVESEIVAKVGRNKIKYAEVPVETLYRDKYKGTTVLDGVKIVLKMLWWKVS